MRLRDNEDVFSCVRARYGAIPADSGLIRSTGGRVGARERGARGYE